MSAAIVTPARCPRTGTFATGATREDAEAELRRLAGESVAALTADPAKIRRAREMRAAGYMIKAIRAETGLSRPAISRACADIQVTEHRGRKRMANISFPGFGFLEDIADLPQW